MRDALRSLIEPWTWRMAWRDSRRSRARLLLFSSTIVMGVCALVAIGSLGGTLRDAIEEQAKGLLGADLVIQSRSAFTQEVQNFFDEIGAAESSKEISFSSMVRFVRGDGTRLVQVRALSGGFPYYGGLETSPAGAAQIFREGGGVLVEESLLVQFDAKPGDEIQIGTIKALIAGGLKRIPGETMAFATLAPRIYVPMQLVESSGMLGKGSLVRHKAAFKLPAGLNVQALMKKIQPKLESLKLSAETVDKRKEDLGESLENLQRFLNLSGFVALLLGAVGIASAVHVQIQEKLGSAAILRCLGASVGQSFSIYLLQALGLGGAGVVAGAILGLALQAMLPSVLEEFVAFRITPHIYWLGVVRAMGIGLGICVLFAMGPLLAVRRISPLAVIRGTSTAPAEKDPAQLAVAAALAGAVLWFGISQTQKWRHGLGFSAGLGVAFGVLTLTAKVLAWGTRRWVSKRLPYVLRQGLANLYRPQNRTVLLMVSLGLGTFLILTLYLTKASLVRAALPSADPNRPNTILFDIQTDQKDGVESLVKSMGMPVINLAPVVTMRISAIEGKSVDELLKEKKQHIPNWTLRREYRSTYRDELTDSETITAGEWVGRSKTDVETIPISLEEGIARDLRVKIGSHIDFDVQGVRVETRVTSLRKVDWRRVQSNFFVVFPKGSLEAAPGFFILTTRTKGNEESANLQRTLVKQYPTVSVVDLSLILHTVDGILGKISKVMEFMAMFSVGTGILVLIGAVLTGRFQRVKESVLLRTLGASRRQVLGILTAEYAMLGLLASATGVGLSELASLMLSRYVFKTSFMLAFLPMGIAVAVVTAITVATGLMMSLGVTRQPPLAVLRHEG